MPTGKKPSTPRRKNATTTAAGGKKTSATTAAEPVIDTQLLASSAARMLLARRNAPGATPPSHQGNTVKAIKQSLNKTRLPQDSVHSDQAIRQGDQLPGHSHNAQIGRNQTSGASLTRSGVPRRTNG